jgi:branched-subunit amino acid transport protein
MGLWLTMIAVGVLTYLQRLSFIGAAGERPVSAGFRRALRFVPVSVLSALVVSDLLVVEGRLLLSAGNERLLAGLVALVLAWRTRSMLWTLLGGMAALLLLQLLLPA